MTDLICKIIAAAALLLAIAAGGGWWLAAHDRNVARTDLVAARKANDDLTSAIHDQNIAVAAMAAQTADAQMRRIAAERAAASALEHGATRAAAVKASTATDCAGLLNEAWKEWK